MRALSLGLALAHSVGLLALVAVRSMLGYDSHPLIALLSAFQPLLFAPLPLGLGVALFLHSKRVTLASLLATIAFAYLYGDFFYPNLGGVSSGPSIKVMALNIGHLGQQSASTMEIVDTISSVDADIVTLEELVPDVAHSLLAELGDQYPYAVGPPETTAIISRLPILHSDWIEPSGGGRLFLQATVDWNRERLNVFAVHPLPPTFVMQTPAHLPVGLLDQRPQRAVFDVAQRARELDGPTIVAGDLNISDQTPAYATMSGVLVDGWREAGFGFGFTFAQDQKLAGLTIPGPFVRIDYIFHSRDLVARKASVGCGTSSDHCYVVTELARRRTIK